MKTDRPVPARNPGRAPASHDFGPRPYQPARPRGITVMAGAADAWPDSTCLPSSQPPRWPPSLMSSENGGSSPSTTRAWYRRPPAPSRPRPGCACPAGRTSAATATRTGGLTRSKCCASTWPSQTATAANLWKRILSPWPTWSPPTVANSPNCWNARPCWPRSRACGEPAMAAFPNDTSRRTAGGTRPVGGGVVPGVGHDGYQPGPPAGPSWPIAWGRRQRPAFPRPPHQPASPYRRGVPACPTP